MNITKAEIKLIRSLADKAGRREHGLFLAEGDKLVDEIANSHLKIAQIFRTPDSKLTHGTVIAKSEMERISLLKTASDSLALVEIPTFEPGQTAALSLVLDNVQDPGNLGTIIRIADWFGIKDIYCSPTSADCFNPKVVQATMGALTRVRIHYTDLVMLLTDCNRPIYGTFLEGENIYDATLSGEGFIVMGNEGRGVTPQVARLVTDKLYIPPYPAFEPTSESLNVAVATAIVCSEFRRR